MSDPQTQGSAAGDRTRTLTAVIRAAFPHPGVPDSAYERTAGIVQKAAAETTWMQIKLDQGLASLDALADGSFADLSPEQALPVLQGVEQTPFFGFVRQTSVVNLYEDEEVWEVLGYEGPSFDKGGYINRGFDDLDWLPDPRTDEYDGEPLPDIIDSAAGETGGAPKPATPEPATTEPETSAADTRPAAVPAGQTDADADQIDTGRSPA